MNSRKKSWLGLVAGLAFSPILVANLAISSIPALEPSAPTPTAGDWSGKAAYVGPPLINPPQASNASPPGLLVSVPPPGGWDAIRAKPRASVPLAIAQLESPHVKVMPAEVNQNQKYPSRLKSQTATRPWFIGPAGSSLNRELGTVEGITAAPRGTAPFPSTAAGDAIERIVFLNQEGQPDPKQGDPKTPATQPPATQPPTPTPTSSTGGLFDLIRDLSPAQAGQANTPQAVVAGGNALGGQGAGDLLTKSNSATGVEVQRRSPLVGDPRIEGFHFGQVVTHADGGYFFPARVDLDSVISKFNSDNIQNILIVKGPFSVRYGPGFSFLDVESLPTPRSKSGCFEAHGSSALGYRTNGQAWQGQQNIWGGNADWGFRLSYDIQSASDYTSGNGTKLPSTYNSQFVNFAYGVDLSPSSSLEVKYLHVLQRDVALPGLLTGINALTTDSFTARYVAKDGPWYDRLTLDTWVNSTSFNGDSSRQDTRQQVPDLDNVFPGSFPGFAPVRLDITTQGNALSFGARETTTWGETKGFNVSLGLDLRVFASNYDEFDAFNFSVLRGTNLPANLGIPNARHIDPGVFLDTSVPLGENMTFKLGTRVDFTTTQFIAFGPNVDVATYNLLVGDPRGDKTYFLFSGFGTAEYKLSDHWTTQAGYGYAQRPPTLTELYTGGAFLGLIQNGANSIYGDPTLRKEQAHQINLNLTAKYEKFRAGANAFYTFLPDYITYKRLDPFPFTVVIPGVGTGVTRINRLQFANTKEATMYGFDAYGEADVLPWLTPFATLSFVEGWDQTRNEALPGIPPLNTRVGIRFHEEAKNPSWGIEYYIRMVATQDLFASTLGEQRTGGFVVHNVRAYWQARENLLLLAGAENIGNLQYREHLDLRTGSGVFQPGFNAYFGMKVTY